MEVLASLGVAAKELFDYNRAMYSFDQTQRLDRELLRLEMQIKRFELFREDIRDLVELTVGKMEMYHLVGALFLEFCACMYMEGRIRQDKAPPFLLSAYWLAVAGAWIYLMLAVMLSLYASISAHSFGVRLLTRFVRLPIPGASHMDSLNARYTDFERQGVKNVMRVPFVNKAQDWEQRGRGAPALEDDNAAGRFSTAAAHDHQLQTCDLLETGDRPFADPNHPITCATQAGHHVQIFRELQAKWQCYDAYARVCMSLGAGQALMSVSFWIIAVCFIDYHAPTTCIALCAIFQMTAVAVLALDVGKVRKWLLMILQSSAAGSVAVAVYILASARRLPFAYDSHGDKILDQTSAQAGNIGDLDLAQTYPEGPICFLLMAIWLEGLLHTAWPLGDAMLPKRFRTVLFLDVFASAEDAAGRVRRTPKFHLFRRNVQDKDTFAAGLCLGSMEDAVSLDKIEHADEALRRAESALRRWKEVPHHTAETKDIEAKVDKLRALCTSSRRALFQEASSLAAEAGEKAIAIMIKRLKEDKRTWSDLSAAEQRDDQFAFSLLGPFEHNVSGRIYYYDLENEEFTWNNTEGRAVLSLSNTEDYVSEADRKVRKAMTHAHGGAFDKGDKDAVDRQKSYHSSDEEDGEVPQQKSKGGGMGASTRNSIARAAQARGRLPWKVLRFVTRMLQIAWLFTGVCLFLQNEGFWEAGYRISFTTAEDEEGHGKSQEGDQRAGRTDVNETEQEEEEEEEAQEANVALGLAPTEDDEPTKHFGLVSRATRRLAGLKLPGATLSVWARSRSSWGGSMFWTANVVDTAWSQGAGAFQPGAMAAFADLPGGGLRVLVSATDGRLHAGQLRRTFRPRLQDVPALPPVASLLCGPPSGQGRAAGAAGLSQESSCLLGAPTQQGLAFWPLGDQRSEAVLLPLQAGTAPWLRFAGATLRCAVATTLTVGVGAPSEEWCFLLVGFDGSRLPVALVPLQSGPGSLPVRNGTVVPLVDAPLSPPPPKIRRRAARPLAALSGARCQARKGSVDVAALHVSGSGRLWAILAAGEVQAWELLEPRPLGSWRVNWKCAPGVAAGWRPTALCEHPEGQRLLIAGRGDVGAAQLLMVTPPAGDWR